MKSWFSRLNRIAAHILINFEPSGHKNHVACFDQRFVAVHKDFSYSAICDLKTSSLLLCCRSTKQIIHASPIEALPMVIKYSTLSY